MNPRASIEHNRVVTKNLNTILYDNSEFAAAMAVLCRVVFCSGDVDY